MNQGTGFICRPEVPDKGCDYDVELVDLGTDVSNWRFALQLKSIENPDWVANNQYISYSFETSRLGYLIRRMPAMGIVVLYDVNTGRIYYDYVDRIYERLMEDKGSDDWKLQDTVKIRVPGSNEFDKVTVSQMHETFINRFKQAEKMQLSHGSKYDLPAISFSKTFSYDFSNLDHIKKLLKEMGMTLLFRLDLQFVYSLIAEVPYDQIINDIDLLILAAVAYCEAGKYADSNIFIIRLDKKYTLPEKDKQVIEFIRLKNQLSLGVITDEQYLEKAKSMLSFVDGATNKVTLRLNILYYELIKVKGLQTMPINLEKEIQDVFAAIESLNCEDNLKCLLKIWNAENLSLWISHFRNEEFFEVGMRETFGKQFSLEEKKERALRMIHLHSLFYNIINDLDKASKLLNDKLLFAYVVSVHLNFAVQMEIQLISHDTPERVKEPNHEAVFLNKINLAGTAYNEFLSANRFKDAYLILKSQLELLHLSREKYHYTDNFDLEELLQIKSQMEKYLEYEDAPLAIPDLLARKKQHLNAPPSEQPMAYVIGLDDEQLDNLAFKIVASGKYPFAKQNCVSHELKAYRLFYERCNNENIELFQVVNPNPLMAYTQEIRFFLRNKLTRLQSIPNSNMHQLLESWGL